jgi:hypothetical protein
MRTGTILRTLSVFLPLAMGCGGKQGTAGSPAAGAPSASTVASASSAAPATPAPRPFASTPVEAQSLIQGQIDTRMKTLWKCVGDYRTKAGDPHRAVTVDIGIDQEGTLLGITTPNPKKGELDPAMKDCMMAILHGLPFPRSHAGIITVRQTFTDVSVAP